MGPVVGLVQDGVVHIGSSIISEVFRICVCNKGILVLILRRNTSYGIPCFRSGGIVGTVSVPGISVILQFNDNTVRPHAVTVSLVVPGFGNSDAVLADICVDKYDGIRGGTSACLVGGRQIIDIIVPYRFCRIRAALGNELTITAYLITGKAPSTDGIVIIERIVFKLIIRFGLGHCICSVHRTRFGRNRNIRLNNIIVIGRCNVIADA